MTAATTSAPPDRLAGRYRLLDPLGTGGMATVWRAWDEQRQLFRAVKILERRVAHSERVRRRLLDEAHIMARLQHPNVVTLYEAGADGDRLYLVMELMLGGSLQERVAEEPLPPRMAVGVIVGVLSALQLAHDNGVVHRDVKPHNLLLDGDGTAKVTDFGIARFEDGGLTRTGAILGTLAYMPPEQKLSARKVDARSDLYSAGATLYALLTGREPHDLYAAALDAAIARELYDSVPAPLAEVIRQATSFRPEERYASASAMAASLAAAAAQLPPDPASAPLVSPDRLAQARSQARLGPTLLSVTADAEPSEIVRMVPIVTADSLQSRPILATPTPAPRRASLGAWGSSLAGVVLLGVAALALAVGRPALAPTPAPAPAAAPPPVSRPVAQGPVLDTAETPVEDEEPRVARSAPIAVDPEPVEDEAPPPALTEKVGPWDLQTWPGNKRTRTDVSASIAAVDPVTNALGEADRPLLILQCLNGAGRLVLRTREPGFAEDRPGLVLVDVVLDGRVEHLRASAHESLPGDLVIGKVGGLSAALLAARTVDVRYPTLGGRGIARFLPGPTGRIADALSDCK